MAVTIMYVPYRGSVIIATWLCVHVCKPGQVLLYEGGKRGKEGGKRRKRKGEEKKGGERGGRREERGREGNLKSKKMFQNLFIVSIGAHGYQC